MRDFILCLGYRADAIKDYFLRYEEALSNDFVLSGGGREVELLGSDIADWRITFADTGLDATIGERLLAVRRHLAGEEVFLANYGDVLSDVPIDRLAADFRASDALASLLAVKPRDHPFRVIRTEGDRVTAIERPGDADLWINGGFFCLRQGIFDVLHPGEELVEAPFARLAAAGRLRLHRHDGFWAPLDTLRDLERLQALAASGAPPWAPWLASAGAPARGPDRPTSPSAGDA